jgi:hypothetical protein
MALGRENDVLSLRHVVLLGLIGLGCDETITGQQPVGGTVDTEAEIQRYLRRAYLDLSGSAPTDDQLATATTRLQAAGNTAAERGVFAGELIATPEFAAQWVNELENAIFAGNDLEAQYTLICGLIRGIDTACMTCTETDSCLCTCPTMELYRNERDLLAQSPADFETDVASSVIERRYALAYGYFILAGAPEGRVRTLFEDFLGRPAEADEVENGRSMIFGAIIPGSPAGLMFHRHGATYEDLVDIVFTSEIYREAMVKKVFERYLARTPTPVELAHFVSTLSDVDPDLRELVRAVVSSREYFEQ